MSSSATGTTCRMQTRSATKSLSIIEVKKKKAEVWKWRIPKKRCIDVKDDQEEPGYSGSVTVVEDSNSNPRTETNPTQNIPKKPKIDTKKEDQQRPIAATSTVTSAAPSSSPVAVAPVPVPSASVVTNSSGSCGRQSSAAVKQANFGYAFYHESGFSPDTSYWSHLCGIVVGAMEGFRLHLESITHPKLIAYKGKLETIYANSMKMERCEKTYNTLMGQYKSCQDAFNKKKRELALTS